MTDSGRGQRDRRILASVRERVSTQLWPVPVALIAVGVALGIILPTVDAAVDQHLPQWASDLTFSGGTDAARSVLAAIGTSLVSATTLTFSLTVVAFQLASSQATPRLLRLFARDPMVQTTLGIFLGTFAYALVVLRTVKDAGSSSSAEVPRISISLALILTLGCVVFLTLFLAHLAGQLRIETMMRQVHEEADRTIKLTRSEANADDHAKAMAAPAIPFDVPRSREPVLASSSGFIAFVDDDKLVRVARELDIVIVLERRIGANVIGGTPFASWYRPNDTVDGDTDASPNAEYLADHINRSHTFHYERTSSQDVGFALRQLVDIATKALSPGINDPTTAVHALGHISDILCTLSVLPEEEPVNRDEDDRPRVVRSVTSFAEYVELGIQQPRRYGAGDPVVLLRIYALLLELAQVGPQIRYPLILEQLDRLTGTVESGSFDAQEQDAFALAHHRVDALARVGRHR